MKILFLALVAASTIASSAFAGYAYDEDGNMIWYGQSGHWAIMQGPDGSYGNGWRNSNGGWDWTITSEEDQDDCDW